MADPWTRKFPDGVTCRSQRNKFPVCVSVTYLAMKRDRRTGQARMGDHRRALSGLGYRGLRGPSKGSLVRYASRGWRIAPVAEANALARDRSNATPWAMSPFRTPEIPVKQRREVKPCTPHIHRQDGRVPPIMHNRPSTRTPMGIAQEDVGQERRNRCATPSLQKNSS